MSAIRVERWDTYEIALAAEGKYDNPFTDVELKVRFSHEESGKTISVDGFYDGDSTWRIRFMPLDPGRWSYETQSGDSGLNSKRGSLLCSESEKDYLHGPLLAEGYHFRHVDGTRRLVVSTRLSCQFSSPELWKPIVSFLKESRINRVFFIMGGVAGIVKELYGQGSDGKSVDFSRFKVERFRAIDRFIDTFRQADILASPYFYYFNDGEQRNMTVEDDRAYIRYGMARFGAYCNVFPVLSNEVDQKFSHRGGPAYDPRSYEWAAEMGRLMREKAVFGIPVTVHNPMENWNATNPGFYTLLLDWPFPWADCMLRQMQVGALGLTERIADDVPEQTIPRGVPYGDGERAFPGFYNPRSFARHSAMLQSLRRFNVPVINEEPGYEMQGLHSEGTTHAVGSWNSQTSESMLSTLWTATLAGAYTVWGNPETYQVDDPLPGMQNSVVPQYIRVLHDFVSRLPYWEMEPADDLVSPVEVIVEGEPYRTNFCLTKKGEVYLIYATYGRAGRISLAKGNTYRITRLNPRTGDTADLGETEGGDQYYTVPVGEWVLLYQLS